MDRRTFIKNSSVAGAAMGLPIKMKNSKLKTAVFGAGLRGQSHIRLLLERDDIELVAVAEIDAVMLTSTQKLIDSFAVPQPKYYSEGEEAYLELLDNETLDLVIIATPWIWHTPMAKACLEKNIYTGLEVSGAFSIDECWELVNAFENSSSHLYFLENVCFRRDVMAVLQMV